MFDQSTNVWRCSRCHKTKPKQEFYRRSLKSRFNWCKECHKALTSRYYHARYSKNRAIDLKEKYGISVEDYTAMITAQGGGCAICGKIVFESKLCVDHNHETGKVRALLCKQCNLILGLAKDQPEILISATTYLKKYE